MAALRGKTGDVVKFRKMSPTKPRFLLFFTFFNTFYNYKYLQRWRINAMTQAHEAVKTRHKETSLVFPILALVVLFFWGAVSHYQWSSVLMRWPLLVY